MPACSSMMRTVPGGNVGRAGADGNGDGCAAEDADGAAAAPSAPDPPVSSAAKTATITSAESPTSHPTRDPLGARPPDGGASGGGAGSGADGPGAGADGPGTGGARNGEACTATPGAARVVRSDQPSPFHHRTVPGAPSGSGYHPAAVAALVRSRRHPRTTVRCRACIDAGVHRRLPGSVAAP